MPDHGIRVGTSYDAATSGLMGEAPLGWAGTPKYRNDWLPSNTVFPAQSFSYERIDWHTLTQQAQTLSKSAHSLSNPPFMGVGNRIFPGLETPAWMKDKAGKPTRILRGYLRCQKLDPADPRSYVRVYFMWNPSELVRNYITSVQDSGTLDPVGGLGQLQPSEMKQNPAMTSVSFALFFDRQTETAVIKDHPGVLVDLQAFDALGRVTGTGTMASAEIGKDYSLGEVLSGQFIMDAIHTNLTEAMGGSQGIFFNSQIPIAMILSPTLAFEGHIVEAKVTFEKFTSRMTPVWMTIEVTMLLFAFGTGVAVQGAAAGSFGAASDPSAFDPSIPRTQTAADSANAAGKQAAVNWGLQFVGAPYAGANGPRADGPPCNNNTPQFDCSSFIVRAYTAIGWSDELFLGSKESVCRGGGPNSAAIIDIAMAHNKPGEVWATYTFGKKAGTAGSDAAALRSLQPGDILIRKGSPGHVNMFVGFASTPPTDAQEVLGAKIFKFVHSTPPNTKEVTYSGRTVVANYQHILKPQPNKATNVIGAVGQPSIGSIINDATGGGRFS